MSNIADELSREVEKITGLSKNHALAINFISSLNSTTFSELVKRMHLNRATMVRILNQLEDQGMIIRTRSTLDRRVVKIELADKAKRVRQVLRSSSYDNMSNSFNSVEIQQLTEMIRVLKEITSAIDSEIASPST